MLQKLDKVLRSEKVRAQILPTVERVRAELTQKRDALMAWEPIGLTLFGDPLPAVIRSSWGCLFYVPTRTREQNDIRTVTNE